MKFYIKKLGCPKNDVDGDYITGRLTAAGHNLSREDDSDVIIVNTCGFILPAKEESIGEILRYEKMKKQGRLHRLYVTGCLSQRYGDVLVSQIRAIDGIFGLGRIEDLIDAVKNDKTGVMSAFKDVRRELDYIGDTVRYIDDSYPYEYLKIADGCDWFCSYCAIPNIRGRYRSRPAEEIIAEAKMLARRGKKELILVSQEGTGYGRDFNNGLSIIDLMKSIECIEGIEWIRLMYMHPESVSDELIEYLSRSEKALGYFDIPLQHISDKMLAAMNRKVNRIGIEEILSKIRNGSQNNIIRTTFIAGFPGETEEDFAELRDFIKDFEFDRLGVFKYSLEEETAAAELPGQVPDELANERMDELMLVQQEIAFAKNIALIGSFQKVIIDKISEAELAEGRTAGDCPEIDQTVIVKGGQVNIGEIVDARITMADGYDLIAESERARQ